MTDDDGRVFRLRQVQHSPPGLACLVRVRIVMEHPVGMGHLGRAVEHISHDERPFAAGVDDYAHGTGGVARVGMAVLAAAALHVYGRQAFYCKAISQHILHLAL